MIERVSLREVEADDLPIFFEQQQDAVANRMAAFTGRDPSDRNAFMAHWDKIRADDTVGIRTILLDGLVVGYVASWVDATWLGKPEVTYWIGREYWGRGIATQALGEFLRHVEKRRPLYGRAASDNLASLRVLEKCGFSAFGHGKSFARGRGTEVEETLLELRGATK